MSALSKSSFLSEELTAKSGIEDVIAQNLYTVNDFEVDKFELNYRVFFEEQMFYGDVKIHLKLKSTLSYIILDKGSNYEVDNVCVKKGSVKLEVDNVIDYPPKDKLIIGLHRKILPGSYAISLSAKGVLSNEPRGFYFINLNHSRKFAVTQLAPNKAKLVFPCFEHPSFKSVFIISLVRPIEGFIAISNMKIDKIIIDYPTEGSSTVKFFPTPTMSCHVVSMIVGTFQASPPVASKNGTLIAVSTRPELIDDSCEVQRVAMSILNAHGKYLRRPYHLGKLDLIAVPFESEPLSCQGYPGVILFREPEIVHLSRKTCKEFVTSIKRLLHEIAHQWIGGVVALNSWDDLWLSEGLTGLVTNAVGSNLLPRWYSGWVSQFFELHPALHLDSIVTSEFNQDSSWTPELDSDIHFYNVHYKSTSILRMLWSIDAHSTRHSLSVMLATRTTFDSHAIWNSFNEATQIDANMFLDSWKTQNGYPLVIVCQTASCLPQIRQIPFARIEPDGSENPDESTKTSFRMPKWDIPIVYFNPCTPEKRKIVWLKKDHDNLIIDDYRGKWIKLNWHQLGYFRVNYTRLMWSNFIQLFHSTEKALDVEDVGNLIDDAFCLADYGHLDHDIPFKLIAYLKNGLETEALPWMLASKHLKRIYHRTFGSSVRTPLEKFFLVLLQNNISEDVWSVDNLPISDTLRKTEILNFAGWTGHKKTVDKMMSIMIEWFHSDEDINVELEHLIVKYGLSGTESDQELFEEMYDSCYRESNPVRLNRLWTALTGIKNEEFVARLVENIICPHNEESDFDEGAIRLAELEILSRNHLAAGLIWDKIKNDWPNANEFAPSLRERITSIVGNICESIHDCSTLESIAKYGEENSDDGIVSSAKYAISDVKRWSEDYCDYITEWLHHFVTNNIII